MSNSVFTVDVNTRVSRVIKRWIRVKDVRHINGRLFSVQEIAAMLLVDFAESLDFKKPNRLRAGNSKRVVRKRADGSIDSSTLLEPVILEGGSGGG